MSRKDLPGAGATDLVNTDPQPDPAGLAANGGPTQTIALLPTSPARNLIPLASCTQASDQRGLPRPQPVAGACDSGAVEARATTLALAPDPASATYGGDVAVTATLTEATGSTPLANRTVEFFLNGASQGTAITDASGVASATIALGTTPIGTYNPPGQGLRAAFAGDATHLPSDDTATLVVAPATSSTVQPATVAYTSPTVTLTATVTNTSNGGTVDSGNVTFRIKQGATTLATGSGAVNTGTGQAVATLNLTPLANFPLGNYTIEATYGPTGNIGASTGTATLTIVKANTRFATVVGETTYGNTTATLRARLVRSNGNGGPVAGAPVVFRLNGAVVCGVMGKPACPLTGADGWATLAGVAIPPGVNGGNHPNAVRASFAGTATHNPADQSGPLQVQRRVLWVKPLPRFLLPRFPIRPRARRSRGGPRCSPPPRPPPRGSVQPPPGRTRRRGRRR